MKNQSRAAFRYIESELFHFHETKLEIENLRAEIMKKSGEEMVGGRSNLPGDPTGETAIALLTDRRLERMEKIVYIIETVIQQLPDDRRRLLEIRYWKKPQLLTWDGIALKMDRDRTTLIRWRNEIVNLIAEYMGI
jgi:RinA family phage transcriptional activator